MFKNGSVLLSGAFQVRVSSGDELFLSLMYNFLSGCLLCVSPGLDSPVHLPSALSLPFLLQSVFSLILSPKRVLVLLSSLRALKNDLKAVAALGATMVKKKKNPMGIFISWV